MTPFPGYFMQLVNEIQLVDVSSMGFAFQDRPHPRGEVCAKGVNYFSGYYKSKLQSHTRTYRF